MANSQVNISLKFNADIEQAKKSIVELQTSLDRLMNQTQAKKLGTTVLSDDIVEATQAAANLKLSLQDAVNVNTGKLDLGKFIDSMKKGDMSLSKYQKALSQLGPEGNQVFSSLANNILQAEIPLKRTNKKLQEFAVTLKNTAKWQISSNIMHGFEGALKSAYGYAQDLNKSLNNIRIVTGASVDEMARFAEQANKSAKALSTTTTDYTNASLIYYQQGLSDQEVKERTDITIKMANAAGQSAEIVSDQMTAVWNNFDDGSKSLEYYADVMTALGAATASSTDEIATGLEKFAAISETVGLSYEYATAALATVTDKTRQSADVVGTAFKTMFARIEGLELGETLDDGTDLNQYSEALAKVGVNIKEANGQLKDMDDILNGMAAVWETLNRDEQVALAQKVAGVRQYNQLISLMENWDAMQANLAVAQGSEGSLQKQADIYAEGWEAAQERVKAAMENIYKSLLNDEFFIDLNNALEDLLTGLGAVIKNMGGLKTILIMVGGLATTLFRDQIIDGVKNVSYSIKQLTNTGKKELETYRKEANSLLLKVADDGSISGQASVKVYEQQAILQQSLLDNSKNMSTEQQKIASYMLQQQQIMGNEVKLSAQKLEQLEREIAIEEKQALSGVKNQIVTHKDGKEIPGRIALRKLQKDFKESAMEAEKYRIELEKVADIDVTPENLESSKKRIQEFLNTIDSLNIDFDKAYGSKVGGNIKEAFSQLEKMMKTGSAKQIGNAFDRLWSVVDGINSNNLDEFTEALKTAGVEGQKAEKVVAELAEKYGLLAREQDGAKNKTQNLITYTEKLKTTMEQMKKTHSSGEIFLSAASAAMSLVSAIQSVKGTIESLNEQDMSFGETLSTIFSGLAGTLPLATTLLNEHNQAALRLMGTKVIETIQTKTSTSAIEGNTLAKGVNKLATWALTKANKGLAGSIISIGTALSSLLIGVAAIAAIFVGVKALIKWFHDNSLEGKIEKSNEKLKELNTSLEECKTRADDLKNSFDKYNSVIDKLKNCVKGTEEWRDALWEVNNSAQDILEKYPELYNMEGAITTNPETGAIEISKEAQIAVQNAEIQKGFTVQGMINQEQQNNQNLKFEELKTQVSSALSSKLVVTPALLEIPVNQILENFEGAFTKQNLEKFLSNLDFFHGYGDRDSSVRNLAEAIADLQSEFNLLIKTLNENSQSTKTANQALASNILTLNGTIESSEILSNAGSLYERAIQREKEGIQENLDSGEYIYKNYIDDYITQRGLNNLEGYKFKGYNDNDKSFTYEYQEEGKDEKTPKTVKWEDVVNGISSAYAQESLVIISENLQGVFDKYEELSNKYGEQYDEAAMNFLAGNENPFANLTYEELMATTGTKGSDEGIWIDSILKKTLGLNEEEVKSLGFGDLSDYQRQINNKINETKDNWTDFQKNFLSDYTLEDATAIENQFKDMYKGDPRDFSYSQAEIKLNELKDYYSSLSEENQKIFAELDLDENDTIQTIQEKIDRINEQNFKIELDAEIKEDAKVFDLDEGMLKEVAEAFTDLADSENESYDSLENNAEAIGDAATRYVRLQDAVLDLSENYDDYNQVLKDIRGASNNLDKAYIANSKNGQALKKSLAGLLGTTEDLIDADLLEAIDPEDFEKAARGDEKAIEKIGEAFIDVQAKSIDTGDVLVEGFTTAEEEAESFKDFLSDFSDGEFIKIDNSKFLQALIQSEIAAGATEADIKNKLSGFNIDVDSVSFYDSLQEAKAAAGEAGDAVVEALSYTTDTEVESTEIESNGSLLGYNETITPHEIKKDNEVLETQGGFLGLGGSTDTKTLETSVWEFDKTITENPIPAKEIKNDTTVKKDVKKGKSSGKPKYAVIKGAKKSVGSVVGSGTATTAGSNMNGKKSGGGGGGGSSKPAKPVKKTKKSDVVERYKEVNDSLDDMSKKLDKAAKLVDRLYGVDKIKAMKEQNKLLQDEIDLWDTKIDQAKDYIDEDKTNLNNVASKYGMQFNYDENGNIINYTDQMTSLYNQLAAAEAQLETFKTQEDQDEYREKFVTPIEEKIEELEAAIKAYEESRELLQDLEIDKEDKEFEKWINEIETVTITFELKYEADEQTLKYLDFLMGQMENIPFKAADRIANYQDQYQVYQTMGAEASDEIVEILRKAEVSEKDIKKYLNGKAGQIKWDKYSKVDDAVMEALAGATDRAQQSSEGLKETHSAMFEEIFAYQDEYNEKIDSTIERMDLLKQTLDYIKDISDVTGVINGKSFELTSSILRTSFDQISGEIEIAKQNLTTQKSLLKAAKKQRKNYDEGTEEWNYWNNLVKQYTKSTAEAQNELYAKGAEGAQKALEIYEAGLEEIFRKFEESLAGSYKTIENMIESMDFMKQKSERYLKDYERVYELTKLNRKIEASLDNTSDLKAKRELRNLQKEINKYAEEGVEMSQYDLEYLQKKYDLRLAEIALEEAQNAKSQVRLTRDASGNYSYVYTADEEKTAEAEQNYEDKLYETQKLSEEYVNELSFNVAQSMQDYTSKIQQIEQDRIAGKITAEEAADQKEKVTSEFKELFSYYMGEMDKVTANNAELYANDWLIYDNFVNNKKLSNEGLQTSFAETFLGLSTGFTTSQEFLENFDKAIGEVGGDGKSGTGLLGSLETLINTLKNDLAPILKNLGLGDTALGGEINFNTLNEKFQTLIGNKEDGTGLIGEFSKLKDSALEDLKALKGSKKEGTGILGLISALSKWEKKHLSAGESIRTENKKLIKSYTKLINIKNRLKEDEDSSDDEDEVKNPPKNDDGGKEEPPKDDKVDDDKGIKKLTNKLKKGIASAIWMDKNSGWDSNPGRKKRLTEKFGEEGYQKIQSYINNHLTDGVLRDYWGTIKEEDREKYYYSSFDTGGYTGTWGADGKLALLHEKELVLNKQDTQNILKTVEMVREISKALDVKAKQFNLVLSQYQQAMMPANPYDQSMKVEQSVQIEAHFPGITEHREIEDAFNNLINSAAQYANRK